jgi:hypothetical protein
VGNLAGGGTASSGSNYLVKVRQASLAPKDFSDAPFTISSGEGPPTGSITVTSPHSGDTWYKGDTKTITWTKTGTMDSNVKIRLRNSTSTTNILDITNSTLNDGNYSWEIPTSVAPGNYVIRVSTTDSQVYGDSDVFQIKESLIEKGFRGITRIPQTLVSPKPDLCILENKIEPEPRTVADTIHYSAKIKNKGSLKSQPTKARLKISLVGSGYLDIPAMDPNEIYVLKHSYKVSKAGIYKNNLLLDYQDKISESNEGNNEEYISYKVDDLPDLPDLIVRLTSSSPVNKFFNARIWASVQNIGRSRAAASTLHFYVQGHGMEKWYVPPLDPGKTHKIRRKEKWAISGYKTYNAYIDKEDNIEEINEHNNFAENKIEVK